MEMIKIENLTKDYGEGRGNFDIFLNIQKGETFGLVGANGAGKTTLIRQIMGFLKPNSGNIKVCELDAWKESYLTKQYIGYVPGEIAFPDLKTGNEFIKSQAEFLKLKDMSYARELIHKLQLDTSANLKRMSKGMKQKTALVVALMNNPEIIILDEASTGLDPLMRVTFLDIIAKEKKPHLASNFAPHVKHSLYSWSMHFSHHMLPHSVHSSVASPSQCSHIFCVISLSLPYHLSSLILSLFIILINPVLQSMDIISLMYSLAFSPSFSACCFNFCFSSSVRRISILDVEDIISPPVHLRNILLFFRNFLPTF